MLLIDGSHGEGGGQILRSSLALSLLTGRQVTIDAIRARRSKPGLRRQHLTAVRAATIIGQADVSGDRLDSRTLSFCPGAVKPGEYRLDVGTAGSASLVLQTILPALLLADGPSQLTLIGGTHNPFAPPYEFLANVFLPLLRRMGAKVEIELVRHGFFPAGGGELRARIEPVGQLRGLTLLERGPLQSQRVTAKVANLPIDIARRECRTLRRLSEWDAGCFHPVELRDASGPGNVVLLELKFAELTELFVGFGRQGVRAERVASEVWRQCETYLAAETPVGEHLADQLLLPMALAAHQGSPSAFRTLPLSGHSTTHLDLLRQFLDLDVQQATDRDGAVTLRMR